jgi:hypothetical protein
MKLTTHPHIVQRSKNEWSYTSTPNTPSLRGAQLKRTDNFNFYLYQNLTWRVATETITYRKFTKAISHSLSLSLFLPSRLTQYNWSLYATCKLHLLNPTAECLCEYFARGTRCNTSASNYVHDANLLDNNNVAAIKINVETRVEDTKAVRLEIDTGRTMYVFMFRHWNAVKCYTIRKLINSLEMWRSSSACQRPWNCNSRKKIKEIMTQ